MAKTVVITQSNYIPWRGYFDLLRSADEVVMLDCVQYTRSDWRNRNLIKTERRLKWLTIPVKLKGRFGQAVDETEIADRNWVKKHLRAIEFAYSQALFYGEVAGWLSDMLEAVSADRMLSQVNEYTLAMICQRLGISTSFRRSADIIERSRLRSMQATERLVEIVKALGADRYLTGPTARAYLDTKRFDAAGIEVVWMNYDNYPPYPQLWGEFEPCVSIVDLLLNTGPYASKYLERR
jgi:hypothetical protein